MNVPPAYLIFKLNVLKKITVIIFGVCLVALFIGQRGFSAGFLVGGLLAAAIFSLLYKYVFAVRHIKLAKKKKFMITRALLIYALMGFALAIGIKKGLPVFLGLAAGLFSLKAAVLIQVFKEARAGA